MISVSKNFIKKSFFFSILFLCTSCAQDVALNSKTLNSSGEKTGMFILRGIAFSTNSKLRSFGSTGKYDVLHAPNRVDIITSREAQRQLGAKIFSLYSGSSEMNRFLELNNHEQPEKKQALKFVDDDSNYTQYPDYFYSVGVLPEGRYYIHSYVIGIDIYNFISKKRRIYFDIKAGKINYIGDLLMGKRKNIFFGFGAGNEKMHVYNRSNDAKAFLKKYYSDIKMPFALSLSH